MSRSFSDQEIGKNRRKSIETIYRTKLRERFQSKKIQARRTRSTLEKFKTDGIKSLRGLVRTINKENEIINEEYEQYDSQFKRNNDQTTDLQFFTKETNYEQPIFDDKVLQIIPSQDMKETIKTTYLNQLWTPKNYEVPALSKIDSQNPIFLSEFGLYVETPPKLYPLQKNYLEQRLLKLGDMKWFNYEGQLKILKSPLISRSTRPLSMDDNSKKLNTTIFKYNNNNSIKLTKITVENENYLHVNLYYVKFEHHPLFSVQHALQTILIDHYKKYKKIEEEGRIEKLNKYLNSFRITKLNLKNYESEDALSKMKRTIEEIKKIREKLFEQMQHEKDLDKKILESWKMLKNARKIDGHVSTCAKLIIKIETQNYLQDKDEMEKELQQLIKEIKYERKLLMKNENSNNSENSTSDEDDDNSDDDNDDDDEDEDEDDQNYLKEIINNYKSCRREPGEPILKFLLEYDKKMITENDNVNDDKEKIRRNAVKNTKIYCKLLLKNIEVCKSKSIAMDDNFCCDFDENFLIKTTNDFEPVTLEIFENTVHLLKKKRYKIDLNSNGEKNKTYFETKQEESIKCEGIGCGKYVRNCLKNYEIHLSNVNLFTRGKISYEINYKTGNAINKTFQTTSNDLDDELDALSQDDLLIYEDLDPQNPKNAILHSLFDCEENLTISQENHNNNNCYEETLTFCQPDEIENNQRLKILRLRDENVPEFYGLTIPINEKEIPKKYIKDYERRSKNVNIYKLLLATENVNKKDGNEALRQIYFDIFQMYRNTNTNLLYDDIVDEEIIRRFENSLRRIFYCLLNWITLQYSLNYLPYKYETVKKKKKKKKKVENKNSYLELKKPLKLILTVKYAINVPKRIKNQTNKFAKEIGEGDAEVLENNSKLCVLFKYENKTISTTKIPSYKAIWNEDLELELESYNMDYMSPDFLNGTISLHLYEVYENHNFLSEKEEKTWLGSTEINISSIFFSKKLDGLFHLETPALVFGYEQANKNEFYSCYDPVGLYLSIKANSTFPHLNINTEELETNENLRIKHHILKWNETYNKNFPNRKFSALVIDIEGKTTCATRFISPIEPPQLNRDNFQVTPEQLSSYFSMFSFTNYNKIYQNIWLTAQQFLKMMTGSVIDHAIILTCCIEYLDLRVWLLLGFGPLQGSTAYVLMEEPREHYRLPKYSIFDVVTGSKFSLTDKNCPLKTVYCVINKHNVWANVQRTDNILNTNWDFTNKSDWLPLFTKKITEPTVSIQQKVSYSESPDVYNLEKKLLNKIQKKIAKERKFQRTVWNTSLANTFKKLIQKIENQPDFLTIQEIKKVQLTQKVKGFLIRKMFNGSSALLEFIKNTEIIQQKGTNSEFILSIHMVPLPNNMQSLWIILAVTQHCEIMSS